MAPACPPAPPYAAPPAHRPRYVLRVHLEPRRLEGTLRVRFTSSLPTDRLVFRLWANGPAQRREGAQLRISNVEVDGRPASTRVPDPTTLVVALRRKLGRGDSVSAFVRWTLAIPPKAFDRIAALPDYVRLGSFFPILGWDPARGWMLDPPSRFPSETSTSPTADFDLSVEAPRGWTVVASGERVGRGRFRATAVRDVALAAGRLKLAQRTVRAPLPVRVVVAAPSGPQKLVRTAASLLQAHARLWGPYPWRTLTVVETPDIHFAGIEYPQLVFVGDVLPRFLLAHEEAHQWFYSLVGNDQARDPWLDEALASWAQGRVGSPYGPPHGPVLAAHVGSPMPFWQSRPRAYFGTVYGGGVEALRALGPAAKVDCALRDYAARNAYGIARPRDLLAALERFLPGATRKLRAHGIR